MNAEDLLRLIEMIHLDRDIPKELVFRAVEKALAAGVRKRLGTGEDLVVFIDRDSGDVSMEDDEEVYELEFGELGRIAAQNVKQGIMQNIRELERDALFDEYEARVGQLVNGTVQRYEGDELVINLGKVEAHLPREERVRGENFSPGDRIRAIILEVRKDGPRVRIIVSRAHADLVRRLFELEVPEVADSIIDIMRVVREPGYRTKMAVLSQDPKIDCIGACVGVRGSRIKAVIDELRGERIDISRWSDSLEQLIMNGLKPATIHIDNIYPDIDSRSAVVIVDEDQQSLAIGKKGQNVRLASRLCGWDIDIKTRAEFEQDELDEDAEFLEGEEGSEGPPPTDADGSTGETGDADPTEATPAPESTPAPEQESPEVASTATDDMELTPKVSEGDAAPVATPSDESSPEGTPAESADPSGVARNE